MNFNWSSIFLKLVKNSNNISWIFRLISPRTQYVASVGKPSKISAVAAISVPKWWMNNVADLSMQWGSVVVMMSVHYFKKEIVSGYWMVPLLITCSLHLYYQTFLHKTLFDFYRGQNAAGPKRHHEKQWNKRNMHFKKWLWRQGK